jgi:hypothetical protein
MLQPLDVLKIHPDDNVCVATRPLPAGTSISCDSVHFVLAVDVQLGAKLALSELHVGDKAFKFGESIGSITEKVSLGGYIHTHNLKSDYLHTHERGELLDGRQSH